MQTVTIDEVMRPNARAGKHYFSSDTLRFFRARLTEYAYKVPQGFLFCESVAGGFKGTADGRRRVYRVCLMHTDGRVERLAEKASGRARDAALKKILAGVQ